MSTGVPGLYRIRLSQMVENGPRAGNWPWCSINASLSGPHHVGIYEVDTPRSSRHYCFEHLRPKQLQEAVRGHNIRERSEEWSIEVEVVTG